MLDDNFNSNHLCSKCLNELHNLTRINNCEICDGKKEEHTQIMINPNRTILSINEENNSVDNEIKRDNNKDICKVCEEEIENEEIIKEIDVNIIKESFVIQ